MVFEFTGMVKVYIVPPQQTQVNLQLLEQNPQLLVSLARLRSPMFGEILVPTTSITDANRSQQQIGFGMNGGNQRMMLDGYNRTRNELLDRAGQAGQRLVPPVMPQKKTILKG